MFGHNYILFYASICDLFLFCIFLFHIQQAQMQQAASRNHAQDHAQLKAMFPQFDDDIIASVYAASNADIDTAAAQLLSLDE